MLVMAPFAGEFLHGSEEIAVEAATIFALLAALDARAPGFAEAIHDRAAVAVDGVLATDWSTPLAPGSEVLVLPRVAGGRAVSPDPQK